MKYQIILRSRSFIKDYRWIKTSHYLSKTELDILETLFNQYKLLLDDHENSIEDKLNPVYFLIFSQASVLAYCNVTKFTDKENRNVRTLQGIAVPHTYQRHFWFALPYILADYSTIIDGWRNLDPKDGGTLEDLIDEGEISIARFDIPLRISNNIISSSIDFNSVGWQKLISLVSTVNQPPTSFLFGVTHDMSAHFPNVKLVALSSTKKTRNLNEGLKPSSTPDVEPELSISSRDKQQESGNFEVSSHGNSLEEAMRRYDQGSPQIERAKQTSIVDKLKRMVGR